MPNENWTDIHEDFSKYHQRLWEERGLTYQDAQGWIQAGLKSDEYWLVSQLKSNGITPQQLASKFSEKRDAQEWIDFFYPLEKRKEVTYLYINRKNLEGSLDLKDFINLEEFYCWSNKLTSLTITNCPQLKSIFCDSNQLTILDISNCEKLNYLDCQNNQLITLLLPKGGKITHLGIGNNQLIFSYLENLKEFDLRNNPIEKQSDPYIYRDNYRVWNLNKTLEKQAKISTFEKEIQRLTNLIKSHKEKIIEAYIAFFQEEELLRGLIIAHLEYKKAQEQKLPSWKLKKECQKLEEELAEKIGEEDMEKIQFILSDCEELIHYETELQAQINQNQKLISDHQQVIQQITYQIGSININKGHGFIGNQTIEEILETKITNTQVGDISIENSQIEGSVAIGVGQITEEFQAKILQPPKNPL